MDSPARFSKFAALTALLFLGVLSVAKAVDVLQLGRAALSDNQPADAERHLIAYLAANQIKPENCQQAFLLLLRAVSDQGRPQDVLALLDSNADIVSNTPPVRIAYWKARSLLELGRSAQALSTVEEGLPAAAAAASASLPLAERLPRIADHAMLLRIQGRALSDTPGSSEKASKAFQAADALLLQDHFPAMKAANLYEWARHEFVRGDRETADDLLGRLDDLSPRLTNGPSLVLEGGTLLRAELLLSKGQPGLAIPLLETLVTNTAATLPNRAEGALSLATLAVQREQRADGVQEKPPLPAPTDFSQTIDSFAKAMGPDQAWKLNRRFGRLLLSATSSIPMGASILSRSIFERPEAPTSPEDRLAIADAWLSISSNALAATEYRSYLEAYPGSPTQALAARRGQATALMRLGEHEEAATLFLKVAEKTKSPDMKAECLLLAAQSLRAGKKFERAADLFTQAAETPSTTNSETWVSSVYFDAADSLARSGNLKNAAEAFLQVSKNGTPSSLADKALYRAATLHDRLGDRKAAISAYTDIIQRTADSELKNRALLGRGRDYYANFDFTKAHDDFKSVDPSHPAIASEAAYYSLFCLYATDRDEKAVQNAETFIKERPDSGHLPSVVLWLAQYHYNRHDYEKAQAVFADYAKRWPQTEDTPKALLWGATAAFERAEYQQSIDLLAVLLRNFPASPFAGEARFLQAKALCNLARYEEAILALDDVINRYPAGEFVTDAWILLGDARFSSASSDKAHKRYNEAKEAYEAARARCKATKIANGVISLADNGYEDLNRFIESTYKIGRCLEKSGDLVAARRHYYDNVINPYLQAIQQGAFPDSEAAAWFARAVLQTADLLEHEGNPEGALSVLAHLAKMTIPEKDQAELMTKRLEKQLLRGRK